MIFMNPMFNQHIFKNAAALRLVFSACFFCSLARADEAPSLLSNGTFESDSKNAGWPGGWSHPDDVNVVGNCLPYRLGPEAWLNAAS